MKQLLVTLSLFLIASTMLFAGSISGEVSGNPVSGLIVTAFQPGNPQSHYVTPVEDGVYTLIDVELGTYIVKLSGIGVHIFYDGVFCIEDATPVELTETNPDVTDINFTIDPILQGIISGHIIQQGGHGGPGFIEGSVLLYDQLPIDPSILPIQEHELMGMMYLFQDVGFGTYYVALEIPEELTLYYDNVEDPNLATAIVLDETNPSAFNIDFLIEGQFVGSGEINGLVTNELGEAVADAHVELFTFYGTPWFQHFTNTDENGLYVLENIPVGEYYLFVHKEMYLPYFYDGVTNWEDATLITVAEDDVITIDPVLQPLVLYSVTGIVLDNEGSPVEGCHIMGIPAGTGPGGNMWSNWSTNSLADGTFELNIPEGDYIFRAHLFNWMNTQVQFYDHKDNWQEADVVTVNDNITDINFDFEEVFTYDAVVSGMVTDENGQPVEDATVFLYPVACMNWYFGHAFTDEAGLYEISDIPPGDYFLSVHAQSYLPYFYDGVTSWEDATVITIAEGDTITIDPVLQPLVLYTVSGFVHDDLGNPVSDCIVFAHSTSWNPGGNGGNGGCHGGFGMLNTQPDENGYFELNVPEGEYIFGAETLDWMNMQIQFYDHKSSPDEADVVLVEDDVTGIDFDFEAFVTFDNSISGNITLAGVPVENAIVVGISADQTFSTTTFTNEFGQYELANLPENDYYIFAYGPGSVPTFYPGVINFEDAVAVAALGIVTGIDFELVPVNGGGYLALDGFVRDNQNQPIANTTVIISDLEDNVVAMAQTNNDGFYEANNVISGDVVVSATKVFYNTSYTTTTMIGNATIDFILESTGSSGSNDTPLIAGILNAVNYPNPFNPSTKISFNIPTASSVEVTVYNTKGQLVTTLVDDHFEAGIYNIVWNGTDRTNKPVSSGIYFYKVSAAGKSITNKMLMLK